MNPGRTSARNASLFLLLALLSFAAWSDSAATAAGEAIFRQGVLPTGEPLQGMRGSEAGLEGAAAACFNCHRRSGLGASEGRIVIPPITGKYLYRPDRSKPEDLDFRYVQGYRLNREPYPDDASVARAIREGIGKDGRELNYLMPRFDLDDASMASLLAYLRGLSKEVAPGVTADTLHFATIITPDADPVKRQAMLAVLERFFADKNDFIRGGAKPIQSSREIVYRVTRRWQLHVWDLAGAPETWGAQLKKRLAEEPVFAVISGLGGRTWEPVHRFCQDEAVPCLFPNVDLPVVEETDFYPMYFSKGVWLEVELIAARLDEQKRQAGLRRVVQVFREDDIGEAAATALNRWAEDAGLQTVRRVVRGPGGSPLAAAVGDLHAGDALVLWLHKADVALLPAKAPDNAVVYLSGLMGGLESTPLPAAWRPVTHMAHPVDLPEQRRFRMNFPLGWLKVKQLPVTAERVQADTYLVCGILSEALGDMLDSFLRDYLEERLEDMLSRRVITGYYPRLGLGRGQRFASKGSYMVRFADPTGTRLLAEGDWTIP